MGPISPVNVGTVRPTAENAFPLNTAGSLATSRDAAFADGSRDTLGVSPGRLPGVSASTVQFQDAVSGLLGSLGGGANDDRQLQLLIALLILIAILNSTQNNAGPTAGPLEQLEQLAAGTRGQGVYAAMYTSSTTITIEQSTTTIVGSLGAGADLDATHGGSAIGDRIDVAG